MAHMYIPVPQQYPQWGATGYPQVVGNNPHAVAVVNVVAAANAAAMSQVPKADLLPIQGKTSTCNMDDRLYQNIQESNFFKTLMEYKSFEEILEKGEESIKYINAWGDQPAAVRRGSHFIVAAASGAAHLAGMKGWVNQHHQPSPAWCILFKIHTMRVTKDQMESMLSHSSPYIRALALIYLRLVLPPTMLWEWFEEHLKDSEELVLTDKPNLRRTTVKEVAVNLLTDLKYLDTRFNRIPESVMRGIRQGLSKRGFDAGSADVGKARDEKEFDKTRDRDKDKDKGQDKVERDTENDKVEAEESEGKATDNPTPVAPRKRSLRADITDEDLEKLKKDKGGRGGAKKDDRDKERERERERDRTRDKYKDDRGDRRESGDKSRGLDKKDRPKEKDTEKRPREEEKEKPQQPEEKDTKRSKGDDLSETLAKLKAVYGAVGSASEESSSSTTKKNIKKNYLGTEKLTLGTKAWGT